MTIFQIGLLVFFPTLMAFAAASDLLTMTISNRISLLLLVMFPVSAACVGIPLDVIAWHLLAGVVMLAVGFTLFCTGWIGGGDAKLMAATAIWLGWAHMAEYALISAMLGGVLTLAILFIRQFVLPPKLASLDWVARLHDPKNGVPYGIALAAAALVIYPNIAVWRAGFGG